MCIILKSYNGWIDKVQFHIFGSAWVICILLKYVNFYILLSIQLRFNTVHLYHSMTRKWIAMKHAFDIVRFIYISFTIYIYTVGTESIQTPLNFSLFVILQPFAKII